MILKMFSTRSFFCLKLKILIESGYSRLAEKLFPKIGDQQLIEQLCEWTLIKYHDNTTQWLQLTNDTVEDKEKYHIWIKIQPEQASYICENVGSHMGDIKKILKDLSIGISLHGTSVDISNFNAI